MNAPTNPRPGIDAFHRTRSKCIDAFSEVEQALIWIIERSEGKVGSDSFGQKLEKLRKAKPSPTLSKNQIEKLKKLIDGCSAINELRNDIVHSTLQLAVIGNDQRACFINSAQCTSGSQTARLFSLEGLRGLTAEMTDLAKELRAL